MSLPKNILEYCKDPEKYYDKYTTDQIEYKSCLCKNKAIIALKDFDYHEKFGAAGYVFEAIIEFIEGMFSPMGIAQVAGLYSIEAFFQAAYELCLKGFTKLGTQAVVYVSELAISELASSMTLIMMGLLKGVAGILFGVAAGTSAVLSTVFVSLKYVSALFVGILDYLSWPLLILQITGMIFDSWDPCSFKNQMNAESMKILSDAYNDKFLLILTSPRTIKIEGSEKDDTDLNNSQVSSDCKIKGGKPISTTWPVYVYGESFIHENDLKDYDNLFAYYYGYYLSSLTYNSYGMPINHDVPPILTVDLQPLSQPFYLLAGNKNTVVTNWVIKYIPILIGVFFLGLIIILFIIK